MLESKYFAFNAIGDDIDSFLNVYSSIFNSLILVVIIYDQTDLQYNAIVPVSDGSPLVFITVGYERSDNTRIVKVYVV